MKMLFGFWLAMTVFTTLCSGQGIPVSTKVAQAILIDLSELDQRRLDAVADSLTIAGLQKAYEQEKNATLNAVLFGDREKELKDLEVEKLDICEEENSRKMKEIRHQKRLKWLAIIGLFVLEGVNLAK